ncbi:hypothetical protein MG290_01710 [Flavobacterium sp. CBA20B-1]|uniref:hypothetical protein n=1 Tax=unclassified Flavobacterium TaxID=196869 RepID=UPI002223F4B6|nr:MULTISPECIES: hypothetical protein [unclassified Flavobacterium]WCM42412.1 hypothetical protein MG290_01710 [Flavobacterium sp. CBA20B-1]
MSTQKIDQEQIDGNLVNSITGNYIDNTDPKNPQSTLPANVATESYVNSQGFLKTEADPKGVASIAFSGTTTKTLTITLNDGNTVTGTFSDMNTVYNAISAASLAAGTSTENKVISDKVLVDYLNARLAAAMVYKGQVTNYANLPTTGNQTGHTYNIVNAFTVGGQNYPAGSNVAWNGTAWDVLAGFIDTSIFLTAETDPTGVASIVVTGSGTKTITVTLNNGSTRTATWTDTNTTYTAGTLATLNAGTDTTAKLWSDKVLNDWLNGKSFASLADVTTFMGTQRNDMFIVVAGNISGGNVTLNLTAVRKTTSLIMAFYNGVKVPAPAININGAGNQMTINQSLLPTPIKVGKQVEVVYMG